MSANEVQVGGSHYQTGYQHWDLMIANNVRYLEAQITKYVTRWKKKNGVQDVDKALHYCKKLIEVTNSGALPIPAFHPIVGLDRFAQENNLGPVELDIFHHALGWNDPRHLYELLELLEELHEMAVIHAAGVAVAEAKVNA